MTRDDIFSKTVKGQNEMETRSHGLSMQHRRVLILVNGSNNVADLIRMSLCDNAPDILTSLAADGFIESGASNSPSSATAAHDYSTPKSAAEDTTDITAVDPEFAFKASEFMCNTLLTFANRIRVSKLIEQIKAVDDLKNLEELIKPWYQAISETPGGMYQADDLRDEVRAMIAREL